MTLADARGSDQSRDRKGAFELEYETELRKPCTKLKLRVARSARERNHVADILHPGQVHHHPLEAHAEAGMFDPAEAPQVQIPPVVLFLQTMRRHFANAPQ